MNHLARRTFLSRIAATGLVSGAFPWFDEPPPERDDIFVPDLQQSDARLFAAARRELLIPPSVTFCNTGTLGACPREVINAVADGLRTVEQDLDDWAYRPNNEDMPAPPMTGYRPLRWLREDVAILMNAAIDEIALTQNSTMGMSLLANGLDLAPGDEIVTTDHEHPGGIGPWLLAEKRRGAVVRQIPIVPAFSRGPDAIVEAFAQAITPRTRVVMFSHITSLLGVRLPARELCELAHQRGVLAIVDGAQAVGQMKVDVREIGCDAYVTSPHKWLCAPKGTGVLYIRAGAQDRFWSTLVTAGFDDRTTGAFRFVRFGTGSLPTALGLRAAVRFMNRLGTDRVERWDRALTAQLRDGLSRMPHVTISTPEHPEFRSAMTTFKVAGMTSDELQDELWKHRIRVRAEGDWGVRLSAHYYVAPADIDRVLDVVERTRVRKG